MNNFVFVIDKSDKRNDYVLKALEKDDFKTEKFIEGHIYIENSFKYVFIFAPSTVIDINIAQQICKGSIIFCLKCDEQIRDFFREINVTIYKYFDDEVLAMRNAYLTAEGTLAYIIELHLEFSSLKISNDLFNISFSLSVCSERRRYPKRVSIPVALR